MKGLLCFVVAIRVVGCLYGLDYEDFDKEPSIQNPEHITFKYVLDWVHVMSKRGFFTKVGFYRVVRPIMDELNMNQDYKYMDVILTQLVEQGNHLRSVILKDEYLDVSLEGMDVDNNHVKNLFVLFQYLPTVYDKLSTLSSRMEVWFKAPHDGNAGDSYTKESRYMWWFKSEGFNDVNELREMTPSELLENVNVLLAVDGPLRKVLSFMSTSYLLRKPVMVGNKLAWLLMLSTAVVKSGQLESKLKEYIDELSPGKGPVVVRTLRNISQVALPIMSRVGTSVNFRMQALHVHLMQLAKFADLRERDYFRILSNVYEDIEDQIREVEKDLYLTRDPVGLLQLNGFKVSKEDYPDVKEWCSMFQQLMHDNSPVRKLSKVMYSDERIKPRPYSRNKAGKDDSNSSDGMHAASISPVALAVLVMSALAMVA